MLTNGVWLGRRPIRRPTSRGSPRRAPAGCCSGCSPSGPRRRASWCEACRQHALPLLTLPIEVPFTAVSHAMADLQASARQQELARSVDRGKALARAIAEGTDERGVLRVLTLDHALPVALVDAGGHVLAVEGTERERIDTAAVAEALAGPRRAEVEFADGTRRQRLPRRRAGRGRRRAAVPARARRPLRRRARGARPDRALPHRRARAPRRPARDRVALRRRAAGDALRRRAPRARAAGAAALVRDRRRRPAGRALDRVRRRASRPRPGWPT